MIKCSGTWELVYVIVRTNLSYLHVWLWEKKLIFYIIYSWMLHKFNLLLFKGMLGLRWCRLRHHLRRSRAQIWDVTGLIWVKYCSAPTTLLYIMGFSRSSPLDAERFHYYYWSRTDNSLSIENFVNKSWAYLVWVRVKPEVFLVTWMPKKIMQRS